MAELQQANVNTPSTDYEEMEKERKLPRALVGGTEAMRKGLATWTPRLKDETDAELKDRLLHYFLVDFYDSACTDLVDRMFSRGVKLGEDVPRPVLDLWDNIDGAGRSGNKFFYDVALDAARYGYSSVQADHTERPRDDEGNARDLSEAETREMEQRPFLRQRKSKNVIAVDEVEGEGMPRIDRARIRETKVERSGDYGYNVRDLVRVLQRGSEGQPSRFEVHEKPEGSGEWKMVESGLNTPPRTAPQEIQRNFREVLLTPFYMGFERFHFARPQFRRAADLCLQHWQKKGDVDFIEHLSNTPSLVLNSDADIKIESLGSRKVVTIPYESKLEWLVLDPEGINATKESIAHLEEHVREMFKQPRRVKASGAELVGVRLMDESHTMTRAQMWAVGVAQSISQCLDQLAWWLGLPEGGTVQFPEDALEKLSDPTGFDDVVKMVQIGMLSKNAGQREAIRYGKLDEDHDIKADIELLNTEAPAFPVFDEGGSE